jgi:hypothetical protein
MPCLLYHLLPIEYLGKSEKAHNFLPVLYVRQSPPRGAFPKEAALSRAGAYFRNASLLMYHPTPGLIKPGILFLDANFARINFAKVP